MQHGLLNKYIVFNIGSPTHDRSQFLDLKLIKGAQTCHTVQEQYNLPLEMLFCKNIVKNIQISISLDYHTLWAIHCSCD